MGNKISGISIRTTKFNNTKFNFKIKKLNFKFDYQLFILFIKFITKFFYNFRFICNNVTITFNYNTTIFNIQFYISYLFFSKINKIPYKSKFKKYFLLKKYFKLYIINKLYQNYFFIIKFYLKTYLNSLTLYLKQHFFTSNIILTIKNITFLFKTLKQTQLFYELRSKYRQYKKYFFGNTSFLIYDIFIQFFLTFYYKSFFFSINSYIKNFI